VAELEKELVKISELSFYLDKKQWVVKAIVMKKGKIIPYKDGGKLFKIEIVDESNNAIECTFYRDCSDIFYDTIEEGYKYFFSKAEVATANKKFTSCKNDYRIIFKPTSLIVKCKNQKQLKPEEMVRPEFTSLS